MGIKAFNHGDDFVNKFIRAVVSDSTGLDAATPYVAPTPVGLTATGGIVSDFTVGSDIYRAHIFTASGEFSVSSLGDFPAVVDLLVVGGGGGGGGDNSGAGGGGGVLLKNSYTTAASRTYTITIGGGGARVDNNQSGNAGGTTSFGSYIQATGGPGGVYDGNNITHPAGGTISGSTLTTSGGMITGGAVDMGSFGTTTGGAAPDNDYEFFVTGGGPGGGAGVSAGGSDDDTNPCDAFGYQGAGGGSAQSNFSGKGAQGSVLIEEIYGEV